MKLDKIFLPSLHRIPRVVFGLAMIWLAGCSQQPAPLVVYAGKGLKNAVEEVVKTFEQQNNLQVSVIYAGSNTLLNTLQETQKGDVLIPGSRSYVAKAGELATRSQYVAKHVPTFVVNPISDNTLTTYADLLADNVRIAVGNEKMAAIGRVAKDMIENTPDSENFGKNIVVKASTVNELLTLVAERKVDAALVWTDMMSWETARGLALIPVPGHINRIKEIWVAELSTSNNSEQAATFADYVAGPGKALFAKHGFGI